MTREEFDTMIDRIRTAKDDDESERGREEFWEERDRLYRERDEAIAERDRYSAELDDQRRMNSKIRERNGELLKRIGMRQPEDEDYAEPAKEKETHDLDSLFDEKGNLF